MPAIPARPVRACQSTRWTAPRSWSSGVGSQQDLGRDRTPCRAPQQRAAATGARQARPVVPDRRTRDPGADPREQEREEQPTLNPTDISVPEYFHKVVDCQWACPAHTPVPEYIRLIAAQRYSDAYMINWKSNVFPGILGRTCDRPCEPACRRGRVEAEPVAICRLKRVAADNKSDIRARLPKAPAARNAKRIALIGAGPPSPTVPPDTAPLGYHPP